MSRRKSSLESNPPTQYLYPPDKNPWEPEIIGGGDGCSSGSSIEGVPSSCFPGDPFDIEYSLIERMLSDTGTLENLALDTGPGNIQRGVQHREPGLEDDALQLPAGPVISSFFDPHHFESLSYGMSPEHSGPVTRTLSDGAIVSNFSAGKFNCGECTRGFDLSVDLEDHARSSKHGAYVCTRFDCGKKFSRRDTFVRHTRGHNSTQPHQCSSCHKKFKRKDHLQQHARKCLRSSSCDGRIIRGKSNVLQTYLPVDSPLHRQLSVPGMKKTLTKLLLTSPSQLSKKEKAECEENLAEDDLMMKKSAADHGRVGRKEVGHQYIIHFDDCDLRIW